jgi:hypothetical protein
MLSVNRLNVLMLRVIAPFYKTLARSSNTLVEYSFRPPRVEGSSPATTACTGIEKMAMKMYCNKRFKLWEATDQLWIFIHPEGGFVDGLPEQVVVPRLVGERLRLLGVRDVQVLAGDATSTNFKKNILAIIDRVGLTRLCKFFLRWNEWRAFGSHDT